MNAKNILVDLILAENLVQIIAEKEYPSMREMARAAKRSLPAIDKAIELIRGNIESRETMAATIIREATIREQRICNAKKT